MAQWTGWVAAVGGALALVSQYVDVITKWGVPLGGAVALVFGIWCAVAD